jgi:Putative MetA-pathway of phenol degradation
MRRVKTGGVVLAAGIILAMACASGFAIESAQVLPKGVWNVSLTGNHYFPIKERFNPDGDAEDVAKYFNADLNSNVFPQLAALDQAFFGGTSGASTIGTSQVSFQYEVQEAKLSLQYGVTDRFTAGILIPYQWLKTNVKQVNLNTANATVGINPGFGGPGPLGGVPLIPIAAGGVPLTTADAQGLLGPGLTINGQLVPGTGLGYKPIQTWEDSGFGDIQLGGRYQYFSTEDWLLAFTGGIQLPTGKTDDPNNLVDLGFGTGCYALLFRLNNDYKGIKDLVLDATFKLDYYLPGKVEKRVTDPQHPLTTLANLEKVDMTIGTTYEIDLGGSYGFASGWNIAAMYGYSWRDKNKVSGSKGLNYGALEENTNWNYQVAMFDLTYSTIPLFREKRFFAPLTLTLHYENVFAGKNYFLKQNALGFVLAAYF